LKDREKSLADLSEQARQRREATGLSLEEISQSTKIHKRFLEAIEQGDIEKLPGLVFSKGFIKNYLVTIGAEDLYPEFESLMKTDAGAVQTESLVSYMPPQKGFQKNSRWWLYALLFAIMAVSLFIVWQQRDELIALKENPPATDTAVLSEDQSTEAESSVEPEIAAVPEESGEKVQEQEKPDEQKETENAEEEGITAPVSQDKTDRPVSADEDMAWLPGNEERKASLQEDQEESVAEGNLVIRASGPCWIRVTRDEEITFQGTLQSGDVHRITVDSTTRIRYGNAGVVRHSWNGDDLGTIGGSGEVVTLEYLPDGSRNRL
jgi:cytoskeletal protein RodZ